MPTRHGKWISVPIPVAHWHAHAEFQRRRCLLHDACEAPNLAHFARRLPSLLPGIMEAACSIDNANFASRPLEFRDPLAPRVGFDVPV